MNGGKALAVSKKSAQNTRHILETVGVWDCSRKLKVIDENNVAIPIVNTFDVENLNDLLKSHLFPANFENECKIIELNLPSSKKSLLKTPYEKMVGSLQDLVRLSTDDFCSVYLPSIPHHWEIHEDLVLLPPESFQNEAWDTFGISVWEIVAHCLGCKRVARKHRIEQDGFRSPRVDLLLGDNGWVQHVDNEIKYSYDVTKCMYSCGNIPEKLRVAQFNCTGETVVDLYAGIGYFTLPYLVHAKAYIVHACEWNPAAVAALQRNLALNGVDEKCVIHQGDNKQVCPVGIADRVNLGLIPSSEEGWFVACLALKTTGGILHIHNNVPSMSEATEDVTGVSISPSPLTGSDSGKIHENLLVTNKNTAISNPTDLFQKDFNNYTPKDCESKENNSYSSKNKSAEKFWNHWAQETSGTILSILESQYSSKWTTNILSVNHVKSYAPHIDHLVLDLECKPNAL